MNHTDLPNASRHDGPQVCIDAERLLNESGRRGATLHGVLDALRGGPKTNAELAEITPRYGARIYDLRKLGVRIRTDRPRVDGIVTYTLEQEPIQ